ncbi:MAG: L,D-transpeptidase family protein [Lachnospiraceae bacterium]|nr:L,D-transpeptidase family protein [Lachnospiraceae bacterium]
MKKISKKKRKREGGIPIGRIGKVLAIVLFVLLFICATGYLVMAHLYDGRFGFGTWVNEVYATGLTPEEVAQILDAKLESNKKLPTGVMLIGRNDKRLTIPNEDLSMQVSFDTSAKKLYKSQNPITWLKSITTGVHYEINPVTTFDLSALETAVDNWEIFRVSEEDATHIEKTENGYELVKHVGEMPVKDAIIETAAEKISGGEYFVSPDTDGKCYREYTESEGDRAVEATYQALQDTHLEGLSYQIGESTCALDADITDAWLLTEEKLERIRNGEKPAGSGRAAADSEASEEKEATGGRYLINGEWTELPEDLTVSEGFVCAPDGSLIFCEEDVDRYVEDLCAKYDTLHKTRDFETADGRLIQVPPGTYGNEIDVAAEKEWLMTALKDHTAEAHTPTLIKSAKQLGEDDIGDNYIEVDIGKQMLYYIQDGNVATSMRIVTGNTSKENDTPPGVYYIYFMQKNRTLRGPNYASFVHYWMAFYGNYGIHDATWRGDFGGELYVKSGSHGCVNIPLKEAGPLYDKVSVGLPVIVHE